MLCWAEPWLSLFKFRLGYYANHEKNIFLAFFGDLFFNPLDLENAQLCGSRYTLNIATLAYLSNKTQLINVRNLI